MNACTLHARWRRGGRVGFTLTELLVAIGIIAILAALSIFSVRGVSKSARLSSATNTVMAVLGNARALAIKSDQLVIVVFRVNWDPANPQKRQITEIVTAQWTGESRFFPDDPTTLTDRYLPVARVAFQALPPGIKVAGPFYDVDDDTIWITQPELNKTNPQVAGYEFPGRMFGVLFGPDGSFLTRKPNSSSVKNVAFVDFNNDGERQYGTTSGSGDTKFWAYDEPVDENYINTVPFLAVYDDDEARRATNPAAWTDQAAYEADLTGPATGSNIAYISRYADRIHFNRYSGVAMTTRGAGG